MCMCYHRSQWLEVFQERTRNIGFFFMLEADGVSRLKVPVLLPHS